MPTALDFAFDNIRNQAYVGTRGRGVWRIDLPRTDLSLVKTDAPDPGTAGSQLTYTLTATNEGTTTASALTVVDTLPVGVHYVTSSIRCTTAPAPTGEAVRCPIADLDGGGSTTFTITARVDPDVVSANGGPVTLFNTARLTSGETIDTDPTNNTASATPVINDLADLGVNKIWDQRDAAAGETIRCTVFVDNYGPSDARGVVITDRVLSGGSFTISNVNGGPGAVCTPVTAVPGGRQFECNVGTIPAATTSQLGRKTLTYDVTATEGQQLDNHARARSDTPDPDDTNNASQDTLKIHSVADLSLSKVGPSTAAAGTSYSYSLQAFNNGPSTAVNVVISDTLPAGLAVTSVSAVGASCIARVPGDPSQPATCTFASVPPGGSTTTMVVTVSVLPDTSGVLHNAARASSETFDPANSNDLDHVDTTVTASADLSVVNEDSPDSVMAGTPISYTITISNAGPSTAEDVSFVDSLSSHVTFTGTTIEHGAGACTLVVGIPERVECQLGDLASGDYVVVHIDGVVKPAAPQGTSVVNDAVVAATTLDPDSANNTATSSTAVNAVSDLAVTLSTDKTVYKPSSRSSTRLQSPTGARPTRSTSSSNSSCRQQSSVTSRATTPAARRRAHC